MNPEAGSHNRDDHGSRKFESSKLRGFEATDRHKSWQPVWGSREISRLFALTLTTSLGFEAGISNLELQLGGSKMRQDTRTSSRRLGQTVASRQHTMFIVVVARKFESINYRDNDAVASVDYVAIDAAAAVCDASR